VDKTRVPEEKKITETLHYCNVVSSNSIHGRVMDTVFYTTFNIVSVISIIGWSRSDIFFNTCEQGRRRP